MTKSEPGLNVCQEAIIMDKEISQIRFDYSRHNLDVSDVSADPIQQFQNWFHEARDANVMEVNAMTLSTVDPEGFPDGRIVLLKGIEEGAFVFYTNYESTKGQHLAQHDKVSLTFFWPELERQVRILGICSKIASTRSDKYFASRPRESQIGAWTSAQSSQVASREVLEQLKADYEQQYANKEIPRPIHWGGYQVRPVVLEYWQGRPGRLHDRIRYQQEGSAWQLSRLAP